MNTEQLINDLHELVDNLGSQRAAAKELGVSPSYLNDVLQGNRNPGKRILKALKLEAVTRYVKRAS